MMDEASLREQIRRLSFIAPVLSEALLTGNFRSVFKGRGMDFDGLREYHITDDAQRMDWNATARFGRPFVKTYKDDRDLSMWLLIDESASMNFGKKRTKKETAALTASLLTYVCSTNNIKVGAIFVGKDYEIYPPKLTNNNFLLKRIALGASNNVTINNKGTELGLAIETLALNIHRRSLVLILSDFLTSSYSMQLTMLSKRNDVAAIRIYDESDSLITNSKIAFRANDCESSKNRFIAPYSIRFQNDRKQYIKDQRLEWLIALSAAKVPYFEMNSNTNPVEALMKFFAYRRSTK